MKILIFIFLYIFLNCRGNESSFKKNQNAYNLSLLGFVIYRSQGNCLRTEITTGAGVGKIHCNRRPTGVCNSSDLIITSGNVTKTLSDISLIRRDVSGICDVAIANSGILQPSMSYSTQDTINQNNSYFYNDSCESSGISNVSNLFNYAEWSFLNSNRGKVAISAEFLSVFSPSSDLKTQSLNCLNYLITDKTTNTVNESLRTAIQDNRNNKRFQNVFCNYGDNINNCPSNLGVYKK